MVLLHPVFSLFVVGIILYVFSMGARHFLAIRAGRRARFDRALHIRLGRAALYLLFLVTAGGIAASALLGINMNSRHVWGAFFAVLFALAGGITGWKLQSPNIRRNELKTAHGIANTLLAITCINQILSGYRVFLM